jgi:hypothetical protein
VNPGGGCSGAGVRKQFVGSCGLNMPPGGGQNPGVGVPVGDWNGVIIDVIVFMVFVSAWDEDMGDAGVHDGGGVGWGGVPSGNI